MQECIAEYLKRLQPYHKTEIITVADEAEGKDNSLVLLMEGKRILARLKEKDYVVLLDLQGKALKSEEFAERIDEVFTYHGSDLVFVVGGSLGVSEEVKKRADFLWQLSSATFPHGIVRLLLVEQLYRAFRILSNEPYHK